MVAASRSTSQAISAPASAIARLTSRVASKTLASSHPAPKPTSMSTVRIDHPPARPRTRPMMIMRQTAHGRLPRQASAPWHHRAAIVANRPGPPPHPRG